MRMRWAVALGCGVGLFAFAGLFRDSLPSAVLLGGAAVAFAVGLTRPRAAHCVVACVAAGGLTTLAVAQRSLALAPLAVMPLALAAVHAYLGAAASIEARPGSLMAAAQLRQILFRASAVVFSIMVVGQIAHEYSALDVVLTLLSFAGMLVFWGAAAGRLGVLLDLAARMTPAEEAMPRVSTHEIDVGVGDAVHVLDAKPGAAYRGLVTGGLVVGDLYALTKAVWRHVRIGGVFVALSFAALALVVRSPPRPPPPLFRHPVEPPRDVPERTAAATATEQSLGWYPQDAPILTDINGDGVDDIIGLRWDWSQDAAPLVLVANDGKTFARLWQTVGYPAQWASSRTRLGLVGQHLFMSDSEGQLRVFDVKRGTLGSAREWKRVYQMCTPKTGPDRVWVQAEGDDYEKGWLVAVDLSTTTAKRPDWCNRALPRCGSAENERCEPKPAPPFVAHERSFVALSQTSKFGVAVVSRAPGGREADTVIGYDPRTLAKRWERPLALGDEPLHASPSIAHQQERSVLYVKYQLKNGNWLFGARDLDTGDLLWRQNPPNAAVGSHVPSMLVKSSRIYVQVDTKLEVIDGASGELLGVAR